MVYVYQLRRVLLKLYDSTSGPLLLNIHGTLLGAILCVAMLFSSKKIPIVITQHSGNPLLISRKEMLATQLAFFLFRLKRPESMIVINDGMGAAHYANILRKHGVKSYILDHAFDIGEVSDRDSKDFVVLSTSRFDKFKRIDLLIRAFADFYRRVKSDKVRLVLAGDGPEYGDLRKIAEASNLTTAIKFIGSKGSNEIQELLQQSDVVVGTSLFSNVNNSIQEAMAFGRPVVAFNSGETSKLIRHMDNGMLVERGNIEAFSESLIKLYLDPALRKHLGKKGQETILQTKSWVTRIKKELDIYESLAWMRRR